MTKKIISIGGVLALLGICIIFLSKKNYTQTNPLMIEATKAETILSLSPNPFMIKTNDGSIDININTGENSINFSQVSLRYDPRYISEINIVQGPFMQKASVLNTFINQESGTITYILALPKSIKPIKGIGTIAVLKFKTSFIKNESTIVSFTKDTLITNDTSVQTLLKKAVGTTIIKQ